MQKNIHPTYASVVFRDTSTGHMFLSRSTRVPRATVEFEGTTYPVIDVEISSDSHPFWTGKARTLDSEGRVERFRRRYAASAAGASGTTPGGDE
ncbi:type B 50S ribosomal protein L31 [Serinicoccus sp. LYQ131]|uniref:type B 50S ribosomal protein L31 n=1 Tax=Serinicoccus sp. LYQ131 TaxID=3378797 RepID=UPI00385432FF